jgi:hypothetical protein
MTTTTYSLHKIQSAESFPFSPAAYSRFKFGDGHIAAQYGRALAEGFIKAHLEESLPTEQLVVISSPYSFIPTATFALKDHFVYALNRWLAAHSLPVVQETKVHRTITYKDDYGALDAAQRMALIGGDSFHIDRQFLTGKTLLFLDDIRITGSHERMILKMAGEYGLQNKMYLLYFGELANGEVHPNVENVLNYYSMESIFDLAPIVQCKTFRLNTRLVKYILHYESADCAQFLEDQSPEFLTQLYNNALGNGYHTIEAYAGNLKILRTLLPEFQTAPAPLLFLSSSTNNF